MPREAGFLGCQSRIVIGLSCGLFFAIATDMAQASDSAPDPVQINTPVSLDGEIISQARPNIRRPSATPFVRPEIPAEPFPKLENQPTPSLTIPESEPTFPPPTPSEAAITVIVTEFEFVGNTALSDSELTQLTESYLNRPLTFTELLGVEAVITQAYVAAGYINSGAVIPANQALNPSGAVVQVQVVEGSVEDINVEVDGRLNTGYIRSRLRRGLGTPLNQNDLLEALQVLQLNPLIENISAELAAGSVPERSVINVRVIEADTFRLDVELNNGRIPSVGSFRRGVRLEEGNVFGFGDRFFGEYLNTDGSDNFNFRYTIPINALDGSVALVAGNTDSLIVEEPFDELDIRGSSPYFELTLRQPVIQTPRQELAFGISASRQESSTELLGQPFPLSPGANADGETRISALRFFQEWTRRSPRSVFALRSQFNLGVDVFGATVNADAPDSQFFDWRGQGQYVRALAPDTLFLVRSDLQLATDALVPLEQFAIGGLNSVRGYRQDTLLTDNGFFASAEVRIPIVRSQIGILQVAPFIDFGVGWNQGANPIPTPEENALLGLGVGLQWQSDDKFSARFDWGIPLTGPDQDGDTLQESGLYFSVIYNIF
ncbi:MAG: ShlB/FhaC/HecB family hemolysin secretion/activation protein [Cyanobacteria bacterium P01_H01_bin.15]